MGIFAIPVEVLALLLQKQGMNGASQFSFKATQFTRITVDVRADGLRVASISQTANARVQRATDLAFSHIEDVTFQEWSSRRSNGEAIFLHRKRGGDVMFLTSNRARGSQQVTESDRAGFRVAAAAVLNALAVARPDIRVRNGRPLSAKRTQVMLLAVVTAATVGAYIVQTVGPDGMEGRHYFVVAISVAMAALYAIYQLKLLDPVSFASIQDVACWMSQRVHLGPDGASTSVR